MGAIELHFSSSAIGVEEILFTPPTTSYEERNPIVISSDFDFEHQGWPGNGTVDNPYVIENVNITSTEVCLNISGTTVYFEVRNCIISSPAESKNEGILLNNLTHGAVRDTFISRKHHGLLLQDSVNCTLVNNTAINNTRYGFYLSSSGSCILTDNIAMSNSWSGFYLHLSGSSTLTNNAANSNSFGFWLDDSADCTLVNNIAARNLWSGFNLRFSDLATLINNTATDNLQEGFRLSSSESCILIDNVAGVFRLVSSHSCILTDNTGGWFTLSFSDWSSLTSNTANRFILVSSDWCTLINNTATNSRWSGFLLSEVIGCTLNNNTANGHEENGFYLYHSTSCVLTNNTATSIWNYAIEISSGSSNNTVFLNRFGHSRIANARDSGTLNSWDDGTSLGNCWDDHGGNDTYDIPGSAGSADRYPCVWAPMDTTPPFIDSLYDTWNVEYYGTSVTWDAWDPNPQHYEIYHDNLFIESGVWDGSSIRVNVDELAAGTYNYTIVVYDTFGYWNSHTIIVIVSSPHHNPPIPLLEVVILTAILAAVTAVSLAAFLRYRKTSIPIDENAM